MARTKKKQTEEKSDNIFDNLQEPPEDFDFEGLKYAAIRLLADNSLATVAGLIRASVIERDDDYVNTACIGRIGRKLTIKYNGKFVYTLASKPIEFAGLLAHEIFHELLKHLEPERYKGNPKVWNIAMDSMIQSTLHTMNKPPTKKYSWDSSSRMYKEPNPGFHITTLMEKIYKLEGIDALLRPPHPLKRISNKETTNDIELDSMRWKIYPSTNAVDAFSPNSKTAKVNEFDVYRYILRKFPKESWEGVVLIGTYSKDKSDDGFHPDARDILDDGILDKICKEVDKMAGSSNKLTEKVKDVIKKRNCNLEQALDQALIDSVKAKIVQGIGAPRYANKSIVMPNQLSRVDFLKICTGIYPVFFDTIRRDGKRVKCNIYIDVSGSVDSYITWLYGCVLELERVAELQCFLFSNKVVPVTMEDLKNGKVNTTGGTDFDCIAAHSLEKGNEEIKKAVIFTDGYASMTKENQEAVKKAGIQYIGAVFAIISRSYNYNSRGSVDNVNWYRQGLEPFCINIHNVPLMVDK